MKKILLLSDTHGYIDDAILKHASEADEIWHAGDIGDIALTDALQKITTVRAVYGNIDNHIVRSVWPENNFFVCEGLKVLITHIAGYPGKYATRAKQLIAEHRPGLFICGHSHLLKVMKDQKYGHLHMNPGAAGTHGFHLMRTMIRFRVEDGSIKVPEVIELGKRGALPQTVS